jgi:hypothetical protein
MSEVLVMKPEEFLQWWAKTFKAGMHCVIMGQTGSGKTVLEIFLCSVRKYVLALDAKGGDTSLSQSRWPRITRWPLPYSIRQQVKDGKEPVRIIIGKPARTKVQRTANRELLRKVVPDLWEQGKWCVVCDEGQILADRRYVGVGDELEEMLIAARDRGLSLIFTIQRPQIGRTTPAASASISQSTFVAVARTRDSRVHNRLAEIVGRPAAEVRGLIKALPQFAWAIFSLDPYDPIRIVIPPPLKPLKKNGRGEVVQTSRFSQWMWGSNAA